MVESIEVVHSAKVKVTTAAMSHFRELLAKEDQENLNLRMAVANAGTVHADISITFCPETEKAPSDLTLSLEGFQLYIEAASEAALEEAVIDFQMDELGGQLSIKAPYLKGRTPSEDKPLAERIQHVLDSEVSPALAAHGGKVTLVDLVDDKIVVLQFGGGCHGCGMVTVTLKQGIEKTLKERFPQIVEIRDSTDHTTGDAPYY